MVTMPKLSDIQSAFKTASLPSYSFPLPTGYVIDRMPSALKDADINRVKGIITAYLTVYANDDGTPFVDPYEDIIEPGAFTKTIGDLDLGRNKKNNPWLCPDLWQHDRNELIGGIARLSEDSKGVIYEVQLAMGVRRAQEAFELADQKMIGSSYGYDPVRFDILPGNIRRLKEIRLREVSQVTFPANDIAPIMGTKQHWGWSHVPLQAALVFDRMAQVMTQPAPPATPTTLESEKSSPFAKAADFAQAWAQTMPDEMIRTYYRMSDVLTSSLMSNINDSEVDDKNAAVDTILSQFGTQLKSWIPEYCDCRDAMDTDSSSGGMGMDDLMDMLSIYSADQSSVSFKKLAHRLSIKSGKVLSSDNRNRIASALASMHTELSGIEEWLSSLEVDPESGKNFTQASTSQKAPSIATPPPALPLTAPNTPVSQAQEIPVKDFLLEVQRLFGANHALNSPGVS